MLHSRGNSADNGTKDKIRVEGERDGGEKRRERESEMEREKKPERET